MILDIEIYKNFYKEVEKSTQIYIFIEEILRILSSIIILQIAAKNNILEVKNRKYIQQ